MFDVHEHSLREPPPEVIEQGLDAIGQYYEELDKTDQRNEGQEDTNKNGNRSKNRFKNRSKGRDKEGAVTSNAVSKKLKVVLIGDGQVGKTSIL